MLKYKELVKTIALTALISALIAFVGGVKYEQSQQQAIKSAVTQAQTLK